MKYSLISTNGHLSTMATFFPDSPYIDSCFNLSTTATFFCPLGERFKGNFFFLTFCLYCSVTGRSLKCLWWQGCQLSSLATNGWIAEEQERWDRTSACNGALYYAAASVHVDLTSPTQTNDETCQIDHDTEAYVITLFEQCQRVLLRPLPTEV